MKETKPCDMINIDTVTAQYQIVGGDFGDLSKFDFEGVYIIYEETTKNIVYIGSAYARTIKERLEQYKRKSDTGNTLMHAICRHDNGVLKVKDIKPEHKQNAIDKILKLK
ncbi:MAG: GIY-YIG nuclease family protein, partial [Clostridia bacterium]|nr:GIY-YIG nuclease family protein [Clostridia bacterium]